MTTSYCIVRTSPLSGRKTFAAKDRVLPEWRESGHSRTGVGVDALLTWKTKAGAEKFMNTFTYMRAELSVEVAQ
jgi:hypothetical protein